MTRLAFVLLFSGDTSLFFDMSIESSLEVIMSVLQTNEIGEHITREVSVSGTPAIAVFAAKVTTLAKHKLSLGRDTCWRNKIMHRHSFLPSYLGVLWYLIIASANIKLARQCLGLVETTRNANFVKADVKVRLSVAAVVCRFDREYVLVLVPRRRLQRGCHCKGGVDRDVEHLAQPTDPRCRRQWLSLLIDKLVPEEHVKFLSPSTRSPNSDWNFVSTSGVDDVGVERDTHQRTARTDTERCSV